MIHYGATEADWFHFDGILDLGQDLLPVVSNASAPISPASKLKMAGKVPSVYDRQRQIVGIARWTSHTATPADLKRWSGEPDYGICLITRSARAIDIDITDEAQALEIRKCVTDHLGELPMRSRADSSKVLFLFALPGDLPKRVIKTAHGLVELLGSGQQAVVAGTHPGGARYEWPAGLPSELRLVTPEELDALWAELERRFAIEPSTTSKASTKAATLANAVSNDPVVVALYEKGLVTGTAADGKIFLTCPFEAEHERESDISATAYLPAHTGGYARGSFLCLHSPCSGRTSADFLNAIGIFEDHRDDFQA
ncbi:MAG: bifunctional DNA primase/polymerase, partial [Deltaproteobacteria bacterium]|nr:bifunctional DNA primase/polymerase [Deltaproteobacteria bacterium]